MTIKITPLDAWARKKTDDLGVWQLECLRETIRWARNSPFYRERLPGGLPESLTDLRGLPLMDGGDLRREGLRLLCAPPGEIVRIVSLRTSGTTDNPKRVCFTSDDQELTADFFADGLTTVTPPGGVMAIMLPLGSSGGVADLICRGLSRIPARPVPFGMLESFNDAALTLKREGVRSLVGVPSQALALARYLRHIRKRAVEPESVLLTADYIPEAIVNELAGFGIRVYKHYGMTEMGFGCAIDCDAHSGQHIRETDLLLEVIEPETCAALPDGEWGEVVFTTLTRRGMPLIRYRTGDISRLLPGGCPCGGGLRRLDDVKGRSNEGIMLGGGVLTMPDMDEAIFALPQVMDFSAEAEEGALRISVATFAGMAALRKEAVSDALDALPAIANTKNLRISAEIIPMEEYPRMYNGKRRITRKI